MLAVLGYFFFGSAIIALGVTWQVRSIENDWWALVKYNLMISPFLFLANTLLSMGFGKGHAVLQNVAAVVAFQTVIYYGFLVLFSYFLLGDKITLVKAIAGISLMAAGIWVLKS